MLNNLPFKAKTCTSPNKHICLKHSSNKYRVRATHPSQSAYAIQIVKQDTKTTYRTIGG